MENINLWFFFKASWTLMKHLYSFSYKECHHDEPASWKRLKVAEVACPKWLIYHGHKDYRHQCRLPLWLVAWLMLLDVRKPWLIIANHVYKLQAVMIMMCNTGYFCLWTSWVHYLLFINQASKHPVLQLVNKQKIVNKTGVTNTILFINHANQVKHYNFIQYHWLTLSSSMMLHDGPWCSMMTMARSRSW